MLKKLKGVGVKTLFELNNVGVYSINDLLFKFPKEYLVFEHDPSRILDEEDCYLEGMVDSTISYFKYKKNVFAFSFYLKYDSTRLKMSIFSNIYVGLKIKQGDFIGVYGKYNKFKKNFSIKRLFIDNLGPKIEPDYKICAINNSKMSKKAYRRREHYRKHKNLCEDASIWIQDRWCTTTKDCQLHQSKRAGALLGCQWKRLLCRYNGRRSR